MWGSASSTTVTCFSISGLFTFILFCKTVYQFTKFVHCLWLVDLDILLLRLSSAVMGWSLCLLVLVIVHPIVVTLLWLLPLWSSDLCPTRVMHARSCIFLLHCYRWACGPRRNIFWVSTFTYAWRCLFSRAVWLVSLFSHNMGGLLNFGSMLLADLFKYSAAKLGSLCLIDVDFICNKAI